MTYFRKILEYARPYKRFAVLNIICNIFYALFSTLSFIALIPVIDILFDKSKRVVEKPVWEGITGIKDFTIDYFNYNVSQRVAEDEVSALIFICAIIVSLFFLKNLFGYLAAFLSPFFGTVFCGMCEMPFTKRSWNYQSPISLKRKRRYYFPDYSRCQ